MSRYEYGRLCMQFALIESHVARNRTDLDIQLRRIAELQEEVNTLKKALATSGVHLDSLAIPLPKFVVER